MSRSVTDTPPGLPTPAESSALCLRCGLCCDGTLFFSVGLKPDEVESAERNGLSPRPSDSGDEFRQPCPCLDGTACRIYRERPASCRRFRCELLKSVETGDQSVGDAQAIIAEARRLREVADRFCTAGEDRARARIGWYDQLQATRAGHRPTRPAMMLAMTALNHFLDLHFRRSDKRLLNASKIGPTPGERR